MELDETLHIHRGYTDKGNLTIIYIIYTYSSSIYRDYDYAYLEIWEVRKRGSQVTIIVSILSHGPILDDWGYPHF